MLKIRALLYDLGRNQRVDMDHFKRVVDQLAELEYNMLVINLEHRFDFSAFPGLAPKDSFTGATAGELAAYGRERGIEVVPQPNLIGHCEGFGAIERYAHLTLDPYTQQPWGGYEQLNLELPEVREKIRQSLREVCEAFPGEHLHVGADEVRRMDCAFPADETKRIPRMIEYFRFLLDEATALGRTVMIWGDMPLHHPELRESLPRDLLICDWHYGPQGSRETLEIYKKEGFRVLAAPAVSVHGSLSLNMTNTYGNIRNMVGDADALGLDGFLLTTWNFGIGTGFPLAWPGIALAIPFAEGKDVQDPDAFAAEYASARFGVDGGEFVKLNRLLCEDLAEALAADGAQVSRPLMFIRDALFRGIVKFPEVARPVPLIPNKHAYVWEPNPFMAWYWIRPILTETVLAAIDEINAAVRESARILSGSVKRNGIELRPLLGMTNAFDVFVQSLHHLEDAKRQYHEAALAQGEDEEAFAAALNRTADALGRLRPGLKRLRDFTAELDRDIGQDESELSWFDALERSLDEHIEALKRKAPCSDALLEFGEFLQRPADITARLTWR